MSWLAERQSRWNQASLGSWERAEPHRRRVTELLLEARREDDQRVCVLGAGNCNDLDLPQLAAGFGEAHLVDLDAEALHAGIQRQGVAGAVVAHGGVDLTGALDAFSKWRPDVSAPEADVRETIATVANVPAPDLPGPFDVVASTCLLSQLIAAVTDSLGERHPLFLGVMRAVRGRHLRLMVELLSVGARGLLISDFTSSDTTPRLPVVPEERLVETLTREVHAGNFFHGLHPGTLSATLRAELAPWIGEVEIVPPWRWDLGPRVYAVTAYRFERVARRPWQSGQP